MVRTASRFRPHKALPIVLGVVLVSFPAWAEDVTIQSSVDQTVVEMGRPLTLTITLGGDLSQVTTAPVVELPDGFQVAARRQSSSLVVKQGTTERTLSFVYVLIPTKLGIFKLGPFSAESNHHPLSTNSVEVTVRRPVLPPGLKSQPQYTL